MSDHKETLNDTKQPLIQHLIELRSRLIKSIILISILFVIAYIYADSIYNFLVQPYADAVAGEAGRRLIFTALHETFFTYLKVALFASLFIALPFMSSEGLRKNRKYVIVGVFAIAAILTPPDPISQIGLGVPILILYEISIYAVRFIERKRENK